MIARTHIASWRAAYGGIVPASVLANLDFVCGRDRWRRIVAETPDPVFVGEAGRRIVGFYHLAPAGDEDLDASVTGEIMALYVAPEHTGRGTGGALLAHALAELKQRGYQRAVLWVFRENQGARRFYERFGFAPDGSEKMVSRIRVAGVRYQRDLSVDAAGDRETE